jgi:crossover junction endodeoxyribonuclease RusA
MRAQGERGKEIGQADTGSGFRNLLGHAAMISLEFPWPPADLSPNRARNVHWSRKAEATRNYRRAAMVLTRNAVKSWTAEGEIPLSVMFYPPDNRHRDRTNMEAAFKAGFDGIADAMGVDDCRFVPTYHRGPPVKYGKVVVTIQEGV